MGGKLRIKVCGVRDPAMACVAVDSGADAIGVVFVPESPRHVEESIAHVIAHAVRGDVTVVGVFKREPVERIAQLARRVPLDEVQLHGDHDEQAVAALAPTPVVKAVAFDRATFEATLTRWDTAAAKLANLRALLVDTPDASNVGGGTGAKFDWSALREVLGRIKPRIPIILAGGLTADNVEAAIDAVRPWGVDVSSGVEQSRGIKDADKVRAFCEAARESP